jgi:cytochrome P450
MATLESILILHAFLRRFDLETTAAAPAIPVERNAMFTNRPVGVKVRVRRRPEPDAGGAPGGCRG